MKRRRLPPKPELPPEGIMYYQDYGLVTVKQVEELSRLNMYSPNPPWHRDPTYNMKITKKPTTTKEK